MVRREANRSSAGTARPIKVHECRFYWPIKCDLTYHFLDDGRKRCSPVSAMRAYHFSPLPVRALRCVIECGAIQMVLELSDHESRFSWHHAHN